MNARKIIFWLLDKFKGGSVSHHYREISSFFELDNQSREQYIKSNLEKILHHAQRTTKYYHNNDAGKGVESFPVVNKNIIRDNSNDFLSSKFDKKSLIPAVTSGSTGTPFKVFHNKAKKNRNTADTIYFASRGGYDLGKKLFYFKIWSANNHKNRLLLFMQNIVPIDVLNLKTDASCIIEKINNSRQPLNFLGYVSALETLCIEFEKADKLNNDVKVNSIITMSEGITDFMKIKGKEIFKCEVLSRYSNIENGIIAQQTLDCPDEFIINNASYYVEILSLESDEVLPYGQLGRIVVTDFYNEAMPLIRYDTGDTGVLEERDINGKKQMVLSRIEGRKLDQIFNTKGELISSYIVYKNMWKYTELEQYQLIQKGAKEFEMKLLLQGKFKREVELRNEFLSYLGDDAIFDITYVTDIPLLDSGKRKKVVNLMNQ